MKAISNLDLKAPETTDKDTLKAWKTIMKFLVDKELGFTGGCKAFYSGEEAGKYHGFDTSNAALVVHYDGGDLHYVFNRDWETGKLVDQMDLSLEKAGFYREEINCWSSAIYKK